jgi:predicted  nucleic acid-binding Zn-ribbon protein
LRQLVDGFGYSEREALRSQVSELQDTRNTLSAEVDVMRTSIGELERQVVTTREELVLQEVGVYDYHHKLEDAEAYRPRLEQIRVRIREMSKTNGGAVQASTAWTVEGSASTLADLLTWDITT